MKHYLTFDLKKFPQMSLFTVNPNRIMNAISKQYKMKQIQNKDTLTTKFN